MPSYIFNQFSPREREVLEALCEGLAAKQIAFKLGVSLATVRTTIRTLLRKTGTKDQKSLIMHVITRVQDYDRKRAPPDHTPAGLSSIPYTQLSRGRSRTQPAVL